MSRYAADSYCAALRCAVLLAFAVAGCREQPTGPGAEREQPSAPPERVVSFAPNITETVFALGQGHRLVGVSSFCDYPPEVRALRQVGGHMNPDLEAVAVLKPDLILLQGRHEKVAQFAAHNNVPVAHVDMDSLDTVDQGIQTIGDALGCPERAEALRARIRGELEAVRNATAGRPRPRVLIITTRQSHDLNNLYTVGGRSFVSELVEIAGGDNIYRDAAQPYIEASKETVVMRAPEVILEFHAGEELSQDEIRRYQDDWRQLASLPAVQNGRIHLIFESHALRPGPRMPEIARLIAAILHPDALQAAP